MYDVGIVGAGIVGAAVAAELSARGYRVVVLERDRAASATSARCEGNLLVSDKGPGPELALAQRGNAEWRTFAASFREELGNDFPSVEYEPKGGLVVATTEHGAEALVAFASEQRDAGVHAEELAPPEAQQLEPWLTDRARVAVWYPEDGQVQPAIAAEALLALARTRGAEVLEHCDVRGGIHQRGRLVGVRTSCGDIVAREIVVAAGPWSGRTEPSTAVTPRPRQSDTGRTFDWSALP